MSDTQDFHSYPSEEGSHKDPQENTASEDFYMPQKVQSLKEAVAELESAIDEQSYPIGEVPQMFQLDPETALPLNSERILNSSMILEEANDLIKHEIAQIQKFQKSIDQWESKIEKNKAMIEKNKETIRRHTVEITYDKKNRDYWWRRAEQVVLDYGTAESASRTEDWTWLIKKYGLKNPDGSMIDPRNISVEELCNGASNNLSGEYTVAGNKYEQAKKDKELINNQLTRENAKFKGVIEVLQTYIQSTYQRHVEPLQDGVLLFKELGAKIKTLSETASYGELREWAEEFLNQYLLENPDTSQAVVNDFRRLSSIPLPPQNS